MNQPPFLCLTYVARPVSKVPFQVQGLQGPTDAAARQPSEPAPGPSTIWSDCPELIRVPAKWFMDPLRQSMRTLVRPCTALSRSGKQLTINAQMPFRCFMDLMSPLVDGGVEGWQRDHMGRLVPTKETPSMKRYQSST